MNRTYKIRGVYTIIFILAAIAMVSNVYTVKGQDRYKEIENKLSALNSSIPALKEKVDISVNAVPIQEFLRGIANSTGLNLTVDPSLIIKITNNFNQVEVEDILIFLCRVYSLDITVVGNIINITAYKEMPKPQPPAPEIKPDVTYDSRNDLLSVDLKNDTLYKVTREITRKSGRNFILAPGTNNMVVSSYIVQMPFDAAIDKLAFSNNLTVNRSDDDFYILEKADNSANRSKQASFPKRSLVSKNVANNIPKEMHSDSISVDVIDQPLADVIAFVSEKAGIPHFFISEIKGEISVKLTNVTYENFLKQVLKATPYSYKIEGGTCFVGDKKLNELKLTRVISLQYRTVEKITELIPQSISKELEIKEFLEQNSLIVTGDAISIDLLQSNLMDLDKVVPVILIEILIVDVNKNRTVSTGISARMGSSGVAPKQSIAPGIDWNVSTESMNKLVNSFNGFGWVNLGKVSPNFYLKIKALEDNGSLKIRSTPKLSTLNGHEAVLTSGETKFYKEEQSNYYGTQNPALSNSFVWKAINADLNVTIKPFVSGDEQITLEIQVQQSEFTPREFESAPPGSVNRTFKSLIRVKNQEMVLLGGLEKNSSSLTATGIPLLSRIPVIKWFFGNRTKTDSNTKLSIFIQPTIIY